LAHELCGLEYPPTRTLGPEWNEESRVGAQRRDMISDGSDVKRSCDAQGVAAQVVARSL
jgi:hypothetical protein